MNNIRKFVALAVCILLLVPIISISVVGFENSTSWHYDHETKILTISGNGEMEDYERENQRPWDVYRNQIMEVVVEEGITKIGKNAFDSLSEMHSVTVFGDTLTTIGYDAFSNCSKLKHLFIPTDSITAIEDWAFAFCEELESFTIGDNVSTIGKCVFLGCDKLDYVHINYGHDFFCIDDSGAIYNNDKTEIVMGIPAAIGKNFIIPDSVTSIARYAFSGCTELETIIIPTSVNSIGISAFYCSDALANIFYLGTQEEWNKIAIGGSNSEIDDATIHYNSLDMCGDNLTWTITNEKELLISGNGDMWDWTWYVRAPWLKYPIDTINISKGITGIGNYAFAMCSVESIEISETVTEIGDYAFYHFESETLELPNSLLYIGEGAFELSKLETINIPLNVETIAIGALRDCPVLTSITVDKDNEYYTSFDGVLFDQREYRLIQYPNGKTQTEYTVPEYATSIEEWAFAYSDNLEKIIVGKNVVSIGLSAFSECANLTEVSLYSNVEALDRYTFSGCNKLKSIRLPKSINIIYDDCFKSCESLADVFYTGTEENWKAIEIGFRNDSLNSATIHYLAERVAEITNAQDTTIRIECESDYFAENSNMVFVAKETKDTNEGTWLKKGIRTFLKYEFYVADERDLDVKIKVEDTFKIKLPIPSNYSEHTITVLHWISGATEPIPILCTPFWDNERSEYCIEFETSSFSRFDICTAFGFEEEYMEVFNAKTVLLAISLGENITATYFSSNPAVATVDENGKITTHSKGATIITATIVDDFGEVCEDTCNIYVVNSFEIPGNFSFAQSSMELIYTNTATLSTTADTVAKVKYTSSNPDVATVDENGVLVTTGRGTATITASFTDDFGEVYETACEVTVKFTFWQWLIYILLFGFLWY